MESPPIYLTCHCEKKAREKIMINTSNYIHNKERKIFIATTAVVSANEQEPVGFKWNVLSLSIPYFHLFQSTSQLDMVLELMWWQNFISERSEPYVLFFILCSYDLLLTFTCKHRSTNKQSKGCSEFQKYSILLLHYSSVNREYISIFWISAYFMMKRFWCNPPTTMQWLVCHKIMS